MTGDRDYDPIGKSMLLRKRGGDYDTRNVVASERRLTKSECTILIENPEGMRPEVVGTIWTYMGS
jgi:hypothetical protein